MSDKYKTYEELKEELGSNYDLFMYEINLQLLMKIDKAIELIKRSAGYKGICTQPETDTFSKLLEILGDKE